VSKLTSLVRQVILITSALTDLTPLFNPNLTSTAPTFHKSANYKLQLQLMVDWFAMCRGYIRQTLSLASEEGFDKIIVASDCMSLIL
jgi:hypothetical protein